MATELGFGIKGDAFTVKSSENYISVGKRLFKFIGIF